MKVLGYLGKRKFFAAVRVKAGQQWPKDSIRGLGDEAMNRDRRACRHPADLTTGGSKVLGWRRMRYPRKAL